MDPERPPRDADAERNLGEQPIAQLMRQHGLEPRHLVAVSTEQLNHKMVARACKGRRLTPNVKGKVLRALSRVLEAELRTSDLFDY